ncbi:H-NS family nucleoid-associated regulatory protein [Burkholderia orbicola]|uniref:H-NS family nucleoid-associated regulatory protein n=1 Tax=Burkholderia orbicola TaxID=2978683 RepID=UPI00264F1FD3|nr:H-NS family nucleoid-associated regulatory protein [Burkholderia orbicola]MDN7993667.1 H-NS family nucleoid-associated regulatory protein [Burkholderia orbicola]
MATLQSIQAKIQKLQAQAEELAAAKSTAALEKIRDLMEKYDVSLAEIEAFVGKRRGRKSQAGAPAKKSGSTAKYADPKTGATWTGHGRAPAWIANAKDRSKFLVDGASSSAAATAKAPAKAVKAGNQVKAPQPALYRDPKSGATWSGRGRAPAWLASVKDRSKFLITGESEVAIAPKAKSVKPATKKIAAKKVAATKKAIVKKAARKIAPKGGAAEKALTARKARVAKSPADGVVEGTTQIASMPAQA